MRTRKIFIKVCPFQLRKTKFPYVISRLNIVENEQLHKIQFISQINLKFSNP